MDEATRRRTWSAKSMVTALRSLLRFLHVSGHVPAGLAAAVPAVAGWGLQSLPRGIGSDLVAAMLAGCDRRTPLGRRDYAILLMLSRMGLRNGEVCRLRLDDIDWQAGEVLVHGKGNRHEQMPLPVDVGQALVEYLTDGRPMLGDCRRVFLIGRAPFNGLTISGMCSIVAAAARRAGAADRSAHTGCGTRSASDLLTRARRWPRWAAAAASGRVDHRDLRQARSPRA